jgi:hypothetical protein
VAVLAIVSAPPLPAELPLNVESVIVALALVFSHSAPPVPLGAVLLLNVDRLTVSVPLPSAMAPPLPLLLLLPLKTTSLSEIDVPMVAMAPPFWPLCAWQPLSVVLLMLKLPALTCTHPPAPEVLTPLRSVSPVRVSALLVVKPRALSVMSMTVVAWLSPWIVRLALTAMTPAVRL